MDCTYKCLPHEINGNNSLLVLLGYNYKIDKFKLLLITILSHESADIYIEFYNFLKNSYQFKPKRITFDFSLGNIKGLNNIYMSNDDIIIIFLIF